MTLDEKDIKVLELLKENSKSRTSYMSKRLKIPITTVHNRIKKLEKGGVIKNYTIIPDYKKIGKEILAYILINVIYVLPGEEKVSQEKIAGEIKNLGAEEVSIITGETDIIAKIRVKNIEELNDFITKKVRNIKGVGKTQTLIVLSSF